MPFSGDYEYSWFGESKVLRIAIHLNKGENTPMIHLNILRLY